MEKYFVLDGQQMDNGYLSVSKRLINLRKYREEILKT